MRALHTHTKKKKRKKKKRSETGSQSHPALLSPPDKQRSLQQTPLSQAAVYSQKLLVKIKFKKLVVAMLSSKIMINCSGTIFQGQRVQLSRADLDQHFRMVSQAWSAATSHLFFFIIFWKNWLTQVCPMVSSLVDLFHALYCHYWEPHSEHRHVHLAWALRQK